MALIFKRKVSPYLSETQAYISRVQNAGGTVVDKNYCNNWIKFLKNQPVTIGETTYQLGQSIWAETRILLSPRAGITTRTDGGSVYLVTSSNLCGDFTTDFTQSIISNQPLMVDNIPHFTNSYLSNNGSLVNLISNIAEIFVVNVKNWVSKPIGGGVSYPISLYSVYATYPRILMISGESGNNTPRISAKRNDNTWVSTTGTNIDANTRSIMTAYCRYYSEKGSIFINTSTASYNATMNFGGVSQNTPSVDSTEIKWCSTGRDNCYQELLLVTTTNSVKDYHSLLGNMISFVTAIENVQY